MQHSGSQPSAPTDDSDKTDGVTVRLDERLELLELTPADAEALRKVWTKLEPGTGRFVESFYSFLFSIEKTAAFLQDPALVARLKQAQLRHIQSLFEAQWSADFADQRVRVGGTHAERGIEPHLIVGAYFQLLKHVIGELAGTEPAIPAELQREILVTIQAVLLDVSLTLESYFARLADDLKAALEIVWKSNFELQQFAQLASHDLKTPLATVANLCDEAVDEFGDRMPSEAAELVKRARDTTFRMSATIDELLRSAVMAHSSDFDEVFSCRDVLLDALEQTAVHSHGRPVRVTIPESCPNVIGNRTHLRECFCNLLSNASKYIEADPAEVVVQFARKADSVVVSFRDNGPGIPSEELQTLFAPFKRLSRHHNRPGTGLGLYFAKCLIEGQGGKIRVESQPGVGTCFFLELRAPPLADIEGRD